MTKTWPVMQSATTMRCAAGDAWLMQSEELLPDQEVPDVEQRDYAECSLTAGSNQSGPPAASDREILARPHPGFGRTCIGVGRVAIHRRL